MIRRLCCVPFDEEQHLPELQDFDCGAEAYQVEISEWIKNSGPNCVLDDLKKWSDLRVWVYTLDDTIVGFGSLGLSKWDLREIGAGKTKIPVKLIPDVGIRREFQGKPTEATNKFDRYSSQILDDLIFKAKSREQRVRWLGLFVHPDNRGAIKLYERHDFKLLKKVSYSHKDFNMTYPAMLLDLDYVDLELT